MIFPILAGTLSFVPMIFSDYCLIHKHKLLSNILFILGCGILSVSTLILILRSTWSNLGFVSYLLLALALLCVVLLLFSVFWAIKPKAENLAVCPPDKLPLVSHGVYVLCRHPGVLFLSGFYGFIALSLFELVWFTAFILFTLADIVYVYYQDKYIFPYTIDRYCEYKKTTPFLIPTASSIKEAIK